MKENHYFNLDILPTLFDKDDMYIKCYLTDVDKIFTIVSTKVNDFFVNIYLRSKLCEDGNDPVKVSVKKSKGKLKKNSKALPKPSAGEHRNGL